MQGVECIVLGTVQLGLGYGRRAGMPPVSESGAVRVLEEAWDLGIRAFDTAVAYGNASARLARWLSRKGRMQDCHITTKVATLGRIDPASVQRACVPYRHASSLIVLAHGSVNEEQYAALRSLASGIGAISGLSLYTPEEVVQAAQLGASRVQGPANVFAQRQLATAHQLGIPYDARSVFLQGVLLDAPKIAEQRVRGMGRVARAVALAAYEAGLQPASALLALVLGKLTLGDRAVLGFEQPEQLEFIPEALSAGMDAVAAFERELLRRCPAIPPSALDPRTW